MIDKEKFLKEGYIIIEDSSGNVVSINKTDWKIAEGVAMRKALEADFDRRMNIPDPIYNYNFNYLYIIPLIISVVVLSVVVF